MVQQERGVATTNALRGKDKEAMLDALFKETKEKEEVSLGSMLGELHKIYLNYKSTTTKVNEAVFVPDDGAHKCSNDRCTLQAVPGKAYHFMTGRVHVCLCVPGYNCKAPKIFHKGAVTNLFDMLYCCEASGKSHICTPEDCDAPHDTLEAYVVCRLTGKALQPAKLSHGWIEDNWRPVFKNSKSSKKCKSLRNTDSVHGKQTIVALSNFPPSGDSIRLDAYVHLYNKAVAHCKNLIVALMPGSAERQQLDKSSLHRVMLRLITLWCKHAKQCLHTKSMLDVTSLQLNTLREFGNSTVTCIPLDAWKVSRICNGHAISICSYLLLLLRHTNLVDSEINFNDYVLAMLYLQRSKFRIGGTCIIDCDPFLSQCLPPASSIGQFSVFNRHNFTATKTHIQAALISAYEAGVPLSCLEKKPIPLTDML